MINRDIHQVVVPPDESSEELIAHLEKLTEPLNARLPKRVAAKVLLAQLLHPFGLHYWVTWNSYDKSSDRLIETGLVCRFCPQARVK